MDVTKAPPSTDLTSLGVGTATNAAAASQSDAAAGASSGSSIATAVTAAADRLDIQPLDVAAALQILIAEVRAELPLPGASLPAGAPPGTEATARPPPLSQSVGLALLESQAMPLSSSTSPELLTLPAEPGAAPLPAPLVPEIGPPILEPLPEVPSLAAVLPGSVPSPTPGTGAGGAEPPESPTGGGLPLMGLPGMAPSRDWGSLEPLLMPPGARPVMPSGLTLLSSPAQASPVLVRLFLQAVPHEAGNPATWSATVSELEGTLQLALDRAVSTVEQWRDVAQVVVDAARETRGLVMSQLSEEPPGPLWLRPEWMWLSPQMERFRRRRRLARRGLSDPDLWPLRDGDNRQEAPVERKEEP